MLSTKFGDLHYTVTRGNSKTKEIDGAIYFFLYLFFAMFETLTWPIWRPIYWFVNRKKNADV